jgi:chemotaxis protein MotB
MGKKKHQEEHENLERWLLTYADLITLLLAFFIMMYTFSKRDAGKYAEVASHLKSIFSEGSGILGMGHISGKKTIDLPMQGEKGNESLKKVEEDIRNIEATENTKKSISVFSDERGVVIRVMDMAFFDPGKADLKEGAKAALDGIVPVIIDIDNHIRIEGHTDDVPISTAEFRSNWELSTRRATEVVRYLVEGHSFPPERISAAGFSEFRPIAPNDTPENRALNRRIEIVVLKSAKDGHLAATE